MSQKESGKPQQKVAPPSFPPPTCPRCFSDNTKFCYYNNYTVSQPRYYCKDCRRYWTHGGAIRNIPTGGTSRKRGRIDSASSTSQVLLPPSTTWLGASSYNPNGGFDCASVGRGTLIRPPITDTTMISFNGGGHSNLQTPIGGVNAALGGVSVGFGGGGAPPPAVDGFRDFGFPVLQQQPHHHPLPPPSIWTTGQNMALNTTLSIPNNFMSIARDHQGGAANVVGVNEWCEVNDIEYDQGDPLQSYKPPSPS